MGRKSVERKREGRGELRRFLLTYLLLMGGFFFVVAFTPIRRMVDVNGLYSKAVAATTAWVLSAVGIACSAKDSLVVLHKTALDVRFGCNGLEAVMIYSVAILAYPAPWKKRLAGLAAGLVVIQVVNLLRIVGLAYAAVHAGRIFHYIHIYVAQGLMIAVSLGLFFLYLAYVDH